MGGVEGDEDAATDETPRTRVDIPRDYWIGAYEVSVESYDACRRGGACPPPSVLDTQEDFVPLNTPELSPGHPQNGLRWAHADVFCGSVGARLPSEAEWEFAARGSDDRIYPWGNLPLPSCAVAHMHEAGYGCNVNTTAALDTLPAGASAVGALHMAGNVAEWVQDCYHPALGPELATGRPWVEDCEGEERVIRGGSLSTGARHLRCSARDTEDPDWRSAHIGVRCVRDLPELGCTDSDRDGYDNCPVQEEGPGDALPADCADDNPEVHPGAEERCNFADDDCNGLVDDSPDCE